ALNYGLPKCQCDIVARMDSDDLSRPDRCEKLLSKMTKEKLDLVGGAIEEFNHEPRDMRAVRMPPLTREEIMKWLKRRNPFNHVSVIFNRKAVQLAGGYEPFAWMEDYWLWVRMIANNCKCANISDVVVDVRTGEGMYARRSNVTYLKSQIHFFSELQKLELINSRERAMAISERTIATLLPTGLVKVAYNKFLREKKGH
ncbi:MAG: glycosyltransferase, partial [Phoenicibacter congonensis]|nr:glycosyltransferase [Phoenicibacter congonensis]